MFSEWCRKRERETDAKPVLYSVSRQELKGEAATTIKIFINQ